MLDAPNTDQHPVISALRSELQARGLDAFILPRFDAHQAEYVAPHDERLAHVTGFTGSAGMAIVTQETVALFVDGRYVVQAASQCAGPVFSHHHLFDEPPEVWLASVAQDGWSIGFDAMHLPPAWYDRFADELAESTALLAPVEGNPVDAIWPDQPAPPMGLIEPFPLQFAGKSSNDKIADLVAEMQTRGAAMMIETQPDNIAWLLNIRGSDVAFNPLAHSFVLAECSGDVHWFVADQKLTTDVRDHLQPEVQVHSLNAFLPALTERVQPGQGVMFDPDFSPSATRLVLKKADAKELPVKSPITLAKARKNPTELEGLRNCHIRDGVALTEFCAWLAAEVPARATHNRRVSEHEAEEKVLFYRRAQPGFISESFRTISAAGGNAAMCHYAVNPETSGTISPDGTYLLDSGGQYETGTTDATRSFSFGPHRPEGYDHAYTAVFKAFHALATLRFPPGTQGHHIDAICRRPLWDLGLDYDHGTGHGIGHRLSVHEHPQRIGKPYNPIDLVPGMILSIEPGFYRANAFGIRIENLFEIIQADDGFMEFRNLTWVPIQTDMLLNDKLTTPERGWLSAYHATVLERIGPHLSEVGLAWAKQT
ncbi:aminopeptidase P family protein [Rhodobacteraceae bacterium B1Z28]|uniref:Aminopeptidase P family protein n=1 Tax=Ruegeria haliotis TaxID=2747601 RepID=A0ABX2PTM2_9RHOB|nr:aminopeptidase P family protein [Ruegeria haliotis]NVO57393.1 aminopeptidase P family protein [Ruegeria haliotis]